MTPTTPTTATTTPTTATTVPVTPTTAPAAKSTAPAAPGTAPATPPAVDNPIFAVAARAEALRAQGADVITLAAGEPRAATGAVHPESRLRQIADWARRHGIWVVSDDIYRAFDYTGTYRSFLRAAPGLRARTVVVGGVSKEHAMTGCAARPAPVAEQARDIGKRDLAPWLLDTAHLAVVPGDAFDAPGRIRVCFAVDDRTLTTAIDRLHTALGTTAPTAAATAPTGTAVPTGTAAPLPEETR